MSKKNLLFIFTDEQAVKTMKCYGNEVIHTPNLDRLAENSYIFDNAYVTQPVCTPSRSTLMTGLYPHTSGCIANNIPLEESTPCFPELGDFHGYQKAYYGKWHLGDEIFNQHGFDEWISIEDNYSKYYSEKRDQSAKSSYWEFLKEHGVETDQKNKDLYSRNLAAKLPEELSKPCFLANEAIDFLERQKDNPFILYVNFLEPHMPFFSCRDNQYSIDDVELPPNFEHILDESNPLKLHAFKEYYYKEGHSNLPLQTKDHWKKIIANYWGLVSLVDTHVGRILDQLDNLGLTEDTIIVFTSDHGDMMSSHRLLAKCTMFEEAVKVPLLVHIPGAKNSGTRISEPVSQVDLVPTLLDAMDQEIHASLDGFSLLPFMKGTGPLIEKNVFIEWNGGNGNNCEAESAFDKDHIEQSMNDPIRTIITPDGWKLNWSQLGEDELYHLKSDPYEQNNLIKKTDYSKIIKELKHKINLWSQRTKDF